MMKTDLQVSSASGTSQASIVTSKMLASPQIQIAKATEQHGLLAAHMHEQQFCILSTKAP